MNKNSSSNRLFLLSLVLVASLVSCVENNESIKLELKGKKSVRMASSAITAQNDTEFAISGECVGSNYSIPVFFNDLEFESFCKNQRWSLKKVDLSSLADGEVLVKVKFKNARGKIKEENSKVIKDTTPSIVLIDTSLIVDRANESSYVLSGTCSEESDILGTVDGQQFSVHCAEAGNWSAPGIDLSGSSDGAVVVNFSQVDTFGNTSTPSSSNLTKDTVLPTVAFDNFACNVFDGVESISGVCSHNGKEVIISGPFSGSPVTKICSGGSFGASLDFTAAAADFTFNTSINIQHKGEGTNLSSLVTTKVSVTTSLPTLSVELGSLSSSSKMALNSHEHPDGIGTSLVVGATSDDLIVKNCISGTNVILSGGVKSAYSAACLNGKARFTNILFDTASIDAANATAFLTDNDPSITASQSLCSIQSFSSSESTKRKICTGYQLGTGHGNFASSANLNETGDRNFPHYICSLDQLYNVRNDLDGYFSLLRDIDMSDTSSGTNDKPWNSSLGWVPIGTAAAPFDGSFHGNDYTLTGLFINRPLEDDIGLFGHITSQDKDATNNWKEIRNVKFQSPRITGKDHVGSLVGARTVTGRLMGHNVEALDVIINGNDYVGGIKGRAVYTSGYISFYSPYSRVTGIINGNNYVGGIAGYGSGAIYYGYVEGSITGTGNYVGGLVGYNRGYWANIVNSYFKGDVTGVDYVGGILGIMSQNNIQKNFSSGTVTGSNYVGGISGGSFQKEYTDNISFSTVNGAEDVGGILGRLRDSSVRRNIFVGSLNQGAALTYGGISGYGDLSSKASGNLNARIDDNYYDLTINSSLTSTQGANTDNVMNNGDVLDATDIVGETTTNLQLEATYTNLDFTSVWEMTPGGGYPRLKCPSQWQTANSGFGCDKWENNQVP